MFPCIEIKLDGIVHNLKILKNICNEKGISLSIVTKILVGYDALVKYIVEQGEIDTICDSRIRNLMEFEEIDVEKWLIRSPMISEAEQVVRYSDVSLNSELEVIQALNKAAVKLNKKHKIILMYECGDLREGCYLTELADLLSECALMDGIEVYGIGTNLSCLNDVLPSDDNMCDFIDAVEKLENHLDMKFKVVSGGASSSIPLLFEGRLPKKINSLRMGEAVFLGNIPVYDRPFINANEDNFILKAEIIELKSKPSLPGIRPENCDNLRKRAIVAIGKQDIYLPGLSCADSDIKVIGGSSDHVILDVTDCNGRYKVGSIVEFKMNYNCLLNAMTSKYIKKKII